MNQAITLKAQAANLVAALAEMGIKMSKSQGLEAIAKQYGVANWDTLNGMLKAKPAVTPHPVLADMPGPPEGVFVEQGPRREYYTVSSYDEDGLALLHDESALQAYVTQFQGLDTVAFILSGQGRSLEFTFRELQGLRYSIICGLGTWELADGDTFLNFVCGDIWSPPEGGVTEPVQLPAIPQMAKSAKGIKLVRMTSHDGDSYDLYFLVPPHLDAEIIKQKLEAEVRRLKQLDQDNEDNPDYTEYADLDVEAFAKSLGVEPVDPDTCSVNWDC